MTIWPCLVVVCSALLNFEVEAAVAATTVSTVATTDVCGLLSLCINASDPNFAACDKILDDNQPPCWNEMKPLVAQLRETYATQRTQIRSCLTTNSDANDNLMTATKTKQCQSMLGNYQHIASSSGWASRKKRDTAKVYNNFLKCINEAQRVQLICNQLSACCPKMQKCSWQNDLQPAYTSALQVKIQLYGIRQKCIATLNAEDQTEYDNWKILDSEPIWTGH